MQLASTLGPPQPLPLQVRSAPDGSPLLVRLPKNNGTRTVQQVLEFWREQRSWWEQPIQREYYLVEAVGGIWYCAACATSASGVGTPSSSE